MKMYDKFLSTPTKYCQFFGSIVLLLFSSWSWSFQNLDIVQEATDWLQLQLNQNAATQQQVMIQPLDSRLPARQCDHPLIFNLVTEKIQRQNTIQVQCNSPSSWQMYISARVSQTMTVVTASKQLPVGTVIDASMLSVTATETMQSRAAFIYDPSVIIGARTKRSVIQGQILNQNDLCLVCKGDVVTIEGISNGLSVTTQVTALQDGTLGDSIRVQNMQSNRIINAQIVAVKKVAIQL